MSQQSTQTQQTVTLELQNGCPKIHRAIKRVMTALNQNGQVQISICDKDLDNGQWRKLKLSNFTKYIQSWNIETGLDLSDNNQSTILLQIQNISFYQLRILTLTGNIIESIQALCSLNCNLLTDLFLDENNLTSISPLRRCNFPLIENIVLDLSSLSELNANILISIAIDYDDQDGPCSSDYRWLFKLNSQILQVATIQNPKRIKSKRTEEVLSKRYPNLYSEQ